MTINLNIGFSIACICLFILFVLLIVYSGGCDTIEEEVGLTTHSSESTVVQNPVQNI